MRTGEVANQTQMIGSGKNPNRANGSNANFIALTASNHLEKELQMPSYGLNGE